MKKPINEIWWCAVSPSGVTLWPTLNLFRSECVECTELGENRDWKTLRKQGWRIAKLGVTEFVR